MAALGGVPAGVGDALAGVELALRLQQAGYTCALATECRLAVSRTAATAGALSAGWHAERHFWRWAAAYGWTRSLAAHALHVAGQVAAGVVRPSRFIEAVGRAAAVATLPVLWPRAAAPVCARSSLRRRRDSARRSAPRRVRDFRFRISDWDMGQDLPFAKSEI